MLGSEHGSRRNMAYDYMVVGWQIYVMRYIVRRIKRYRGREGGKAGHVGPAAAWTGLA